jgi:4'-phosphopantetheinyl transferase
LIFNSFYIPNWIILNKKKRYEDMVSLVEKWNILPVYDVECNGDVQVYVISITQYLHNLSRFFEILSREEKFRAKAITHTKRKKTYIIGHGLLRILLAHFYTPETPPECLEFQTTTQGKPLFFTPSGIECPSFNLSYSQDMVAIALSVDNNNDTINAVGVDIEAIISGTIDRIPWDVLTSREISLLTQVNPKNQYAEFLKIWTLKEAFAKASGLGVRLDFRMLEVSFHPTIVRQKSTELETDTQATTLHTYYSEAGQRYLLAIACTKIH